MIEKDILIAEVQKDQPASSPSNQYQNKDLPSI